MACSPRVTVCLLGILLGSASLLSPIAAAQETSALINQALDQPVSFKLENALLPEAMTTLGRITGVRVEATPAVWDLLPWGQQTNINAKIENKKLREALDVITRKLALTYVLKDEAIELQPMPALRRLGRRATIEELQSLDLAAGTPLNLSADRPAVKQLVDAVQAKLTELKSPFAIEYRPGNDARSDKVLSVPRNASIAEALESLTKETELTWYPWGKSFMIVPKEDQVRVQLSKTISMRFPGVDVAQVLSELSERSSIYFEMEPGAVQRVPAEFRTIHLALDNSPISQALETISGFTGLGHVVTPRGIYIWNKQWGQTSSRDPIIGAVTLEGTGVQLFLRQSEVPADMREFMKTRSQKELEKLRQQMLDQGFKPSATQPTQPSSNRLDQFRK